MMFQLLALLLSLAQSQLTGTGPGWRGNSNIRHVPLPGTNEPKLKPIRGLSCRHFVAYNEDQTAMNVVQGGDLSCSGELLDQRSGSFRQLNHFPTAAGELPVIIHSPTARVDAQSRIVILLTGGPRAIAITTPLSQQLEARGFTVVMPLYLGLIETRHPGPDLPGAIREVRALERWAGSRLVGTIGISAGAYLAAAVCTLRCTPRILLAPPLTTPEDAYADTRIDWNKALKEICLWQEGGPQRVCAAEKPFMRSFWDHDHYRTRLADLLKGRCDRVKIIVSPDDTRVYDPRGIADLRSIGCAVETPVGYEHSQMDRDPTLNDHTIDSVARIEGQVGGRFSAPK